MGRRGNRRATCFCGISLLVWVGLVLLSPTANAACGDKVTMLSTTWCGFCRQARAFFHSSKVQFAEFDVEKLHLYSREDADNVRQLRKQHTAGVPLILVGTEVFRGFSEPLLRRALCISDIDGSAGLLDQKK